ncbi:AMP-binding protein [Streptomyces sp. NPDC058247]|uniref:AMP-binding protein n=1 Tax=Streptomyces sp. NPDC058247 TaxID=3346401 RepID=UPI0036E2FFD3
MHLTELARRHPGRPAVITAATGESLSYRALDEGSVRIARLLADRGLAFGDHVAIVFDNTPDCLVVAFACQRAGLYWTPVNHHLTADEAAYIVDDCGAKALLVSARLAPLAREISALADSADLLFAAGGAVEGFEELERAAAAYPAEPPRGEREGTYMFYSSGTTGRPKGILPALVGAPFGSGLTIDGLLSAMFGFAADTVYLSPAPLYHAAPIGWSMGTIRGGGTVVLMERFDAAQALAAIERYAVTHAQFVPTMLIRMLKLHDGTRESYDTSSLRTVVHAAAPCPVEVKRRVIEWLGPIVHEYYAGSEGGAFFTIGPEDWLAHPGSVGRATLGRPVILDDAGKELPIGEVGTVWFEGGPDFSYHNDPAKTAAVHDAQGRSTLGDLGRVDEDGYLYLVDRRTDLILSGGVNIYPQETENALVLHPAVVDAAVVGVPDPEMGRRVHAMIQAADGAAAGSALAAELVAHCRGRLAHYKCPRDVRDIEFVNELPRTPTGKLLRRLLTPAGAESDAGTR